MAVIILGIFFIAFTIFSLIPAGPLNWWADVLSFLKGFGPVLAAFLGLICFFIGAADIKDKREAKKEADEEKASEEAEK